MSLKEQMEASSGGKAIMFVGAGGTLDCTSFSFSDLPTVNPLLAVINKKLQKNISSLPTAASMLADRSISEYYQLITSTYSVLTVPEDLVELMHYPWQKIYTTNYDNALELACRNAQIPFHSFTPYETLEAGTGQRPVVHLHGFVERFTTENIRKDCILDFTSNVANDVYTGYWGTQIKNDIANADICVFLGYSLYDPEVPKILRAADNSKKRIYFINSHQENEELHYRQSFFGTPMQIARDGFSRIAKSALKQGRKVRRENFTCFDRPSEVAVDSGTPGQLKLESHFLFGNRDLSLLAKDARDSTQSYVILPKIVDDTLAALSTNDFVTIYSNLGYGKSVAARILLEVGYRKLNRPTFLLKKDQPELISEFEYICANFERPIIIVEDIAKFKRHWTKFAREVLGKGSLVVTSRFNIFENSQTEIEAEFIDLHPVHLRIDSFTPDERSALVPLISQASLWGEHSNLSASLKGNLIAGRFRNNFADLLIGLMNSSDLIGRYKRELMLLKELSPSVYDGVILCIYLEFIDAHPDEVMLQDSFGKEIVELSKITEVSDLVRNFILVDRSGTYFSSSIFSKFAIETLCDKDDLARVIEDALVNLVHGPRVSGDLFHVAKELMRFNYLKSLARDGNYDRVAQIYDRVSRLSALNEHDLFWLQYGMLERARKNFPKARRHLVESRGYARKRGSSYVPFQTENQLLACILEMGVYESMSRDEAFKDSSEIIDLLGRQLDEARSSSSEQPFQWFELLDHYLVKWLPQFSDEQRRVVTSRLGRYRDKIKTSINGWNHRAVVKRTVDTIDKHVV